MESIVAKIAKDIENLNASFERDLNDFSSSIENNVAKNEETFNYYERLRSLGFSSICGIDKTIQQKNEYSNFLRFKKTITDFLNFYKNIFPLYRIISLKDMILINEKYKLISGNSKHYINPIPIKNLQDIEKFKHEYLRIEKGIFEDTINPLLIQARNSLNSHYNTFSQLYITAPKSHFKLNASSTVIGTIIHEDSILNINESVISIKKEIEEEKRKIKERVLDPIVWTPVSFPLLGGACVIITKWGEEASYPEFINGIEN